MLWPKTSSKFHLERYQVRLSIGLMSDNRFPPSLTGVTQPHLVTNAGICRNILIYVLLMSNCECTGGLLNDLWTSWLYCIWVYVKPYSLARVKVILIPVSLIFLCQMERQLVSMLILALDYFKGTKKFCLF